MTQAHPDCRVDCRVPRNVRPDALRHRRGRHGRAVPLKDSRRHRPRRLHQHHAGLGTGGHHGPLHCRKSFWRTSQPRRHPHLSRSSAVFPGARSCLIPSRKPQEHFLPPLWSTATTCPRSTRFDPQLEKTAGVFTTFPAFPALPQAGFLDQVIGTALLLLMVLAITDELNVPPGANLAPAMIGLVVVAIGMSFGGMHGYPINPARDFGPRLFTAVAGFKNNGLTDGARVWWVPVFAPLLGGLIGAAVYDFGIRRFLRASQSSSQP